MTDILADIDDTLADWNGSKDSMRWRPTPVAPTAEQYEQVAEAFRSAIIPAYQRLAVQVTLMWEALKPLVALMAEPRPSALDTRYQQRQRNRRKRRR